MALARKNVSLPDEKSINTKMVRWNRWKVSHSFLLCNTSHARAEDRQELRITLEKSKGEHKHEELTEPTMKNTDSKETYI